jgi:hypothetical protein
MYDHLIRVNQWSECQISLPDANYSGLGESFILVSSGFQCHEYPTDKENYYFVNHPCKPRINQGSNFEIIAHLPHVILTSYCI